MVWAPRLRIEYPRKGADVSQPDTEKALAAQERSQDTKSFVRRKCHSLYSPPAPQQALFAIWPYKAKRGRIAVILRRAAGSGPAGAAHPVPDHRPSHLRRQASRSKAAPKNGSRERFCAAAPGPSAEVEDEETTGTKAQMTLADAGYFAGVTWKNAPVEASRW